MKTFDVRHKTQDIVDMLNEYQPTMIGSYPTALELLAYEQESGNLHVNPAIPTDSNGAAGVRAAFGWRKPIAFI